MTFLVKDPVLGEDVAAMVVPADEKVTEPELRRYLLDRMIPFKVPGGSILSRKFQGTRRENHCGTLAQSGILETGDISDMAGKRQRNFLWQDLPAHKQDFPHFVAHERKVIF